MRTGFNDQLPLISSQPGRYVGSTFVSRGTLLPGTPEYDNLVNTPYRLLGQPGYAVLVDSLRRAGVLGRGAVSPASVQNAWESILGASQQQNTLWSSVLSSSIMENPVDDQGGGMGPYLGGTQTGRYETVTVYDQNNVRGIADRAYGQFLGRKASRREREALASILNERPPQITEQVVSTNQSNQPGVGGYRSVSSTTQQVETTPQVPESVLAEQQAMRAKDFPARFAESVFVDELLGAMRSPI